MIVDDEEMVRMNLEAFLEDEQFAVLGCETGEEALQQIESFDPHLAIVDMRLPGMDGNEFILEIKTFRPDIKIIIHTGSTEYSLPAALISLGITSEHILYKPLSDMSVIAELARQLLD